MGVPGGAGRLIEVGEVGEGGPEDVRENVGSDFWERWLLDLRSGCGRREGAVVVEDEGLGLEDVRVGDQGRDNRERV